ncbi:hypothetical protein ACOSQ3_021769 [Xanthoceras sorbifolium]
MGLEILLIVTSYTIATLPTIGIASTLVCHPLEVLKDRLTVSRDVYPNLSIAISKIYKNGGVGAFYAGISPTLIGMLPYSTCFYFLYETMKKSYCKSKNKKSLNRPEMLVLGALAAALSEVIREEGLLGLYRGWGASCLKVMPSSGITWKDILLGEKRLL